MKKSFIKNITSSPVNLGIVCLAVCIKLAFILYFMSSSISNIRSLEFKKKGDEVLIKYTKQ